MKKISALLLFLLISVAVLIPSNQIKADSQKMSLIESFTNVSENECPQYDSLLNKYAEQYPHLVIPISIHVDYPASNDPMYQTGTINIKNRQGYYNVYTPPKFCYSGYGSMHSYGLVNIESTINYYADIVSKHDIEIIDTKNSEGGEVSVTISSSEGLSGQRLRIYVAEKKIHYETAPGTNGEKDFYWVGRDMLPDAVGTRLDIEAGDTKVFNFTYENNPVWNPEEIYIIAFIQDSTWPKDIYQAATSIPKLNVIPNKRFASIDSISTTNLEFTVSNPSDQNVQVRLSIDSISYIPDGWEVSISSETEGNIEANSEINGIVTMSPNGNSGLCRAVVKVETLAPENALVGTKTIIKAMTNKTKNILFTTGSGWYTYSLRAFFQTPSFINDAMTLPADQIHLDEIDPALLTTVLFNYNYHNSLGLCNNSTIPGFIREVLEADNNVIISAETELFNAQKEAATSEAKFLFNNILEIVPNQDPVIRVNLNKYNQVDGGIPTSVKGISSDLLGAGLDFTINEGTTYYDPYTKYTDILGIDGDGESEICLYYDDDKNQGAAVKARYKRGKIFYMTFGFHAFADEEDGLTLMQRISDWFVLPLKEPNVYCVESLSFGETEAGKTVKKSVRISNMGEYKLELINISVPEEFADVYIIEGFKKNTTVEIGDYELITVTFKPDEEGDFNTDLIIESSIIDTITTIALTGSATPNSVDDSYADKSELLSLKISPNPITASSILTYDLNFSAVKYFEITLIDSRGREVLSLFKGQVNPGLNELTVDVSKAVSGTYYISAKSENFSTQIPVVIIK